jgi:hypothetical protein
LKRRQDSLEQHQAFADSLPGSVHNIHIWTPSQDQDESEGDGEQERLQSYIRHHE